MPPDMGMGGGPMMMHPQQRMMAGQKRPMNGMDPSNGMRMIPAGNSMLGNSMPGMLEDDGRSAKRVKTEADEAIMAKVKADQTLCCVRIVHTLYVCAATNTSVMLRVVSLLILQQGLLGWHVHQYNPC